MMSSIQEEEKPFNMEEYETKPELQVSIKLSSINKRRLNDVCKDLSVFLESRVAAGSDYIPRALKTKTATITTRKSPCGEGRNTWARYKLHVYSKVVEIMIDHDNLSTAAEFLKSSDVEIILTIKN